MPILGGIYSSATAVSILHTLHFVYNEQMQQQIHNFTVGYRVNAPGDGLQTQLSGHSSCIPHNKAYFFFRLRAAVGENGVAGVIS